jgi:adenosylcobinamide-phosphate synthase
MRIAPLQATGRDMRSFCAAALVWCALAAIVLIVSGALQWVAFALLPVWGAALVVGLLLKPMLAWRMLRGEVLAVEDALAQSLDAGRERLSWLVSRDVQGLDAAAVRESAIESLAENLSDSVVAPLFWFVLLGLPGAALYRFANTADAMWGYPGMRGGRYWKWAGKWAARADDVLSWLPARITAVLLWGVSRGNGARWTDLRAQSRLTPSPNGGWPMGAMALALGVRLSKPGVYVLNAPGRAPQAADTQRAVHLASKTLLALVALAVTALLLIAIVHTHV